MLQASPPKAAREPRARGRSLSWIEKPLTGYQGYLPDPSVPMPAVLLDLLISLLLGLPRHIYVPMALGSASARC